jgi:hypothetical protein
MRRVSDKEIERALSAENVNLALQCQAVQQVYVLINDRAKRNDLIAINHLLVKTSALFKSTSSNFLKLVIQEVFKTAKPWIVASIVPNSDLVLNSFETVLTSNDTISRAITLEAFCSLSFLMRERLDLHHRLFSFMHSQSAFEFEGCFIKLK